MELKIYSSAGSLKLTASPNSSSTVSEEVMGEYCVSAAFTHTAFVLLDVNDYAVVDGVKYKVRSTYRPKQKNTQTYEYNVKLYAPIHDAEDALFLFQADGEITTEFSYDGDPRAHLQLWVDNMNRIAGQELWSIGTVITGDYKTIEYKNIYCWDAAFGNNGIAAAFGTEMWADGYVINLCKAERGDRVSLGYLQGLTSLAQEENGEVRFFTRLFPLGSTRNIDASRYGHARLQLPSGAVYVDKNTDLYGIKDGYEEEAFAGIYPKYAGTVTSVRTEKLTNEEGRAYTVYYFKDNGMDFNPADYEIPDYVKMVSFQTGELAGRGNEEGAFQANWHEDTQEWEIINVYPDDTTQLPGGEIVPKVGDTYIPWNFTLPQEYIDAAEQEYAEAVDDYLSTYSFDTKKYNGTTDRNYIETNSTPLKVGWNVRLLSTEYFTGGYKDTRITKVVRKLNDLCQATLTCTDRIGTGWKRTLENHLDSLQYELARKTEQAIIDIIKTTDTKTPSDYNVYSALRARLEFLSKTHPETMPFLMTFLDGMVIGEHGFAGGLAGFGARIDKKGYGEMRGLRLWEWLEVPELRFNRVEIFLGIKWRTPGGGIIQTCVPDTDAEGNPLSTGTCTLKLEGNELGAVAVDDIVLGIYHFGNMLDATEDSDDSKGNFTFAGFATTYFRITGVSGSNNGTFTYSLRPGYTVHPQTQMHFACYGNFTNESRQTSVYETRTYTRKLWKQNTWEIGAQNIAQQDGDLSNLNIHGMQMEGYSAYLNSVYFTGQILQTKPDGTPVRTANDRGAWETGHYDYYDRVSHNGCIWLCVNEDGTDTEPAEGNPDWLLQVRKGDDGEPGPQGVSGTDGKDGKTYYTWIRYADDAQGTGISNNPTGKEYIGFAYNKETATESNNPADYKWSLIKGEKGNDGTSLVNMGGWHTGLLVPYMGIVRMGGASWQCINKNGTSNPPLWTITDKDNNRLLQTQDSGKTYGYILTGEENTAEYVLVARDGTDGAEGVPGTPGKDGKTLFTWIRYADDAQGTGISDHPSGKAFIGFAYNKESSLESNNPEDYTWSDIKGEQGVPGEKGADGTQYYTWIAYSDNADGSGMYQQPKDSTQYIGIAVNKTTATESTNPADYTWSRFKGEKGDKGDQGPQGIPGEKGADGKTKYTWIRYADNAQGGGISNDPTGKSYIGLSYNRDVPNESNDPTDYTWSLIKGEKGDQGVPGEKGADGTQYYTWIAYSDNADGSGMYQQPKDSTLYIGIAVNKTTATESTNPTDYTWSRFKGEKGDKGDQGPQGIPGEKGADGKTKYTWIRYADNAQGGGISNDPTGKSYIGLSYNRDVPNESNDPTDYTWSLIKGEKGDQGVPGEKGADGTQYYTWIAYSDNADGSGMYQQPKDSTLYIGIAVNKTTATESTNPTDYTWSRFKGEKGDKGDQGIPGPKGEDGTQYWTWVAYSDNADGSNMYQVPNEDTKYIGIAVNKLTQTESSDPADYTWSKFKGEDGAGISNLGNWYTGLFVPYLGIVRMGYGSYMCINKNGTSNPPLWTITDKDGNRLLQTQDGGNTYGYILTGEMNTAEYVLVAADGADGVNGVDGIQGPKGEDGRTTYFHVKYSANPDGNPMSETPSVYIGTYVDYTEEDSDDYTKYTWSRFQGLQGEQGIPGTDGTNGITYYWHIKYSNDGGATFTANNGETPGKFMGTLVDTNPTDSSTPSAYKWAEIKGDKGDKGDQGDKGDKGEDGTSVSHHGDWKTGKFIPYMGIVRMGGSSWICINANGTSNPPCWTITDSAGNRLLQTQDGGRTYGYILTGENNTAEYDLVAEDGKPGADGKPGDKGEQGLQGCILRRSEWKTGTEYRNDEALTSGTRYLDVALVQDNNAATGWRAYKCRQTHTSSSANAPGTSGGNTYWEEFGINTTAIFTSLIIAKDALINFMSGNQLLIRKDDGTVTIGLTGGYNNKAYIWAGGTTPDNARFRVDELGKAVMTDSEVHGTIYAISGQIGGFTIVGNSLQNTGDGYITITNGKRMAGIGGGLAGILGYDAAGVFRNEGTYSLPAGTVNIAAYLSASGAQYNFAFQGRGNGVLSGIMEGYALNYVDNTSANVTDLTRGKYIEMNTPSGNVAHVLPRKTHVEGVLGVSSTTAFAVLLHYFGKYESGGSFTLYGRTTSVSGANTAEFPYLYDHNGNNVSVQIAKGDSAEVLLVYDGAQYFAQLLNVRN